MIQADGGLCRLRLRPTPAPAASNGDRASPSRNGRMCLRPRSAAARPLRGRLPSTPTLSSASFTRPSRRHRIACASRFSLLLQERQLSEISSAGVGGRIPSGYGRDMPKFRTDYRGWLRKSQRPDCVASDKPRWNRPLPVCLRVGLWPLRGAIWRQWLRHPSPQVSLLRRRTSRDCLFVNVAAPHRS